MQHVVQNQAQVKALTRSGSGRGRKYRSGHRTCADLVLLDKKEGRHATQRLGWRVLGVIGVLLEAKAKGHITQVRPCLDAWRQNAGFYLGEQRYQVVLEANESSS